MKNTKSITAFFAGKPSGQMLWYLDYTPGCIRNVPDELANYCDLLDDLGCCYPLSFSEPFMEVMDCSIKFNQTSCNNEVIQEYITPIGSLRSVARNNHPIEYFIKSPHDCEIMAYVYKNTKLIPCDKCSDGVVHQVILGPSPVQNLLQWGTGIENFYFLMADARSHLEELMDSMQMLQMHKTEIACSFDIPVIYQAENTSTTMISPDVYVKYSLNQLTQQAEYIHSKKKKFVLHMCGLLKDLLLNIKQVGIDGIHSVTPPPVGNTMFNDVFTLFGNNFPIQGRLGSTQWLNLSKIQILKNIHSILPAKIVFDRPFILLVTLDTCPTDYAELKRLQSLLATAY